MYRNDGYMKTQKPQFENRIRIQVTDEMWNKITSKFIKTDEGFTSLTVNKRLRKANTSRENGSLGGRPPKVETQKTQQQNLKRKRKEREGNIDTHGKGRYTVTIKKTYAGDQIQKIHDLKTYFTNSNQIDSLGESGWTHFDAFMEAHSAKVFNDADHLYNTFRLFCTEYKPPPKTNKYENAEYNKTLWTNEAWEENYKPQLSRDNEFRKHFGYDELRIGPTMGSNGKG